MTTIKDVADAILAKRAKLDGRMIVAIAGPPGSGKSTLASDLPFFLKNAIIVEMDGFHLDNAVLEERELKDRKGSPESFDVDGFSHLLGRLQAGHEVLAPVFDRELDLSRAGAVTVLKTHDIIVIEGNYLLLDEAPWSGLHPFWDMTIMLDVPKEILKARLMRRWLNLGLRQYEAEVKVAKNDLPNAERVLARSIEPDLVVGNLSA